MHTMHIDDVPTTREAGTKRHPFMRVSALLLIPLLLASVVACGNSPNSPNSPAGNISSRGPYEGVPEGKPPGLGAPVPNPKEVLETKSAGQMPDFLSQLDGPTRDKTAALYKGAMDDYNMFQHIPCYCGCAIYQTPHKSLAECFIKEKKSDGEVVFTDHGLTCDLCQQAAQMTVDAVTKGTPPKDIRAAVYNKLKYTGIWTDTPPAQ